MSENLKFLQRMERRMHKRMKQFQKELLVLEGGPLIRRKLKKSNLEPNQVGVCKQYKPYELCRIPTVAYATSLGPANVFQPIYTNPVYAEYVSYRDSKYPPLSSGIASLTLSDDTELASESRPPSPTLSLSNIDIIANY